MHVSEVLYSQNYYYYFISRQVYVNYGTNISSVARWGEWVKINRLPLSGKMD